MQRQANKQRKPQNNDAPLLTQGAEGEYIAM